MTKPKHPVSLATSDIEYLYWCRYCQRLFVEPTDASRTNTVDRHRKDHASMKITA